MEMKDYLEVCSTSRTGLRWKQRPKQSSVTPGEPAFTSVTGKGYYEGYFKGKRYLAHRVIVYLLSGKWPEQVDHIDGNRSNNCPTNLRAVNAAENQHNKLASGFKLDPRVGRYQARIRVDGKQVNLGSFATKQEAQAAYLAAKRTYHPTAPERCYVK